MGMSTDRLGLTIDQDVDMSEDGEGDYIQDIIDSEFDINDDTIDISDDKLEIPEDDALDILEDAIDVDDDFISDDLDDDYEDWLKA